MDTIDNFTQADIIVGIPSHNEEDNISFVTKQVNDGLIKYFPDNNSIIINVDCESTDDTKSAFLNTKTEVGKLYLKSPDKLSGKGYAFRMLFNTIDRMKCPVNIVVDADLKSITTEWIRDMATQIIQGNDYATPYYARHPYDGTITNNILYPLCYGLLQTDIRQPIGGDFAFSNKLVQYWMQQDWSLSTYRFGIDNFMTFHAILGNFKIVQVSLGAKIHKPSAPRLNQMFTEVLGTFFTLIRDNSSKIKKLKDKNIPIVGSSKAKPMDLPVDKKELLNTGLQFWKKYKPLVKKILPEWIHNDITSSKYPQIDADYWSKIVYLHLAEFIKHNNPETIEALKPLYFFRILEFIKETEKMSPEDAEKEILKQAEFFKMHRDYYLQITKNKE